MFVQPRMPAGSGYLQVRHRGDRSHKISQRPLRAGNLCPLDKRYVHQEGVAHRILKGYFELVSATQRYGPRAVSVRKHSSFAYRSHGLPSNPAFRSGLGGFGPSHTEKSTGANAGAAIFNCSLPLRVTVVPVPGT